MNPFNKRATPDKLTSDIADMLNKNRQAKADAIPDSVKNAAKAAGAELRGMGKVPIETKNKVYNDHLMKAVGDNAVSSDTRASFETIADMEFQNPSE